jgi:hypothetical protein
MNFRESFVHGQSLAPQPGFSLRSRPCRKSPLPPFIKRGIGGDFREGLTKQDFSPHFKLSFFERPGDESRTFRTKPKIQTGQNCVSNLEIGIGGLFRISNLTQGFIEISNPLPKEAIP